MSTRLSSPRMIDVPLYTLLQFASRRRAMSVEPESSGGARSHSRPQPSMGLRLRPLPVSSAPGFPLDHEYFEVVYAPVLGPTAILVARAMSRHIDCAGGPVTVCPLELALEVGIRASRTEPLGKRSHLVRAIERLVHDDIVVRLDDRVLGMRQRVPPLGPTRVRCLPDAVQGRHAAILMALDAEEQGSATARESG